MRGREQSEKFRIEALSRQHSSNSGTYVKPLSASIYIMVPQEAKCAQKSHLYQLCQGINLDLHKANRLRF